MTPKERFKTILKIQEPDRVPWTPFFLGATSRIYGAPYDQWSQYGDIAARCMLASQNFFGFDLIFAAFDAYTESAGFGQEILFPEGDPAYPATDRLVIQTPDDYFKMLPYDPGQPNMRTRELVECCDILMDEAGENIPVIAIVNGPLNVLAALRSKESLITDCANYKEPVLTGLKTVSNVLQSYTKALAETGAMIMFDTSFASRQRMDRRLWLETEGRFMPQLAETARQAGASVAVYCGGQGPYFDKLTRTMKPEIIATAFVPDDCKDWAETKRKWGNRVALCGAVSTRTLASGDSEQVKEACRFFIQDLAAGGGYVLAPGCEYPPKANLHGARAMKEVVEHYGTYARGAPKP